MFDVNTKAERRAQIVTLRIKIGIFHVNSHEKRLTTT